MKLGKAPATHDQRDLLLGRYVLERKIPVLPARDLGHAEVFPPDWEMLGNDAYGDCVFAGAAHETMLWTREANGSAAFNDQSVLSDYTAVTGFNSQDPGSDQGTNMRDAMNYRRKTGIMDVAGTRHKIGAFVALQPGNITQLKQCIWLFGTVAVGLQFPGSAMDQFNQRKPWTVVSGAQIEGGHYVPGVLYHAAEDMFEVITWGQRQLVAPSFLQKYMDEGYGLISTEALTGGRSLEGFDLATLTGDLTDVGSGKPPVPSPMSYVADDGDRALWTTVKSWTLARHVGSNKTAAQATSDWAKGRGLS